MTRFRPPPRPDGCVATRPPFLLESGPMTEKIYVAADLGAGSGRVIAGRFDGSRLRFEETNRFDNSQTPLPAGQRRKRRWMRWCSCWTWMHLPSIHRHRTLSVHTLP